jgi:hypothetical protein
MEFERTLFRVTHGTYQSAFLAMDEGIALFDAPLPIGHNLRQPVDELPRPKSSGGRRTPVFSQRLTSRCSPGTPPLPSFSRCVWISVLRSQVHP